MRDTVESGGMGKAEARSLVAVGLDCVYFEKRAIRATFKSPEGVRWFVVVDLKGLTSGNPAQAVRCLDEHEKRIIVCDTCTGAKEMVAVNESGLYALAVRAKGATTAGTEQHRFRRWVKSEILPGISERGFYAAPGSILDAVGQDPALKDMLEVLASTPLSDHSSSGGVAGFSRALFEMRELLDAHRRAAVHDRTDGLSLTATGEVMVGQVSTGICSIGSTVACRAAGFKPRGVTDPRPPAVNLAGVSPPARTPSVVATVVRLVEEALASGLSVVLWIEDFEPEDRVVIRGRVGGRLGVSMVKGPSSTRLP